MPIVSTEPDVRAALLTRLATVTPPLGRLHDIPVDSVLQLSYPTDNDEAVMGWETLWGDKDGNNVELTRKLDTGSTLVYRNYTLRGWRSVASGDGSAEAFRVQVTQVTNVLKENLNLAVGIELVTLALPEVVFFGDGMFEKRLCHIAMIEVTTQAEEHVPEWP